ncbi:hypothetical protein BGX20_001614, partial [Mortierella sp. AD010]
MRHSWLLPLALLAITKSSWASSNPITGEASMLALDPTGSDMMLPTGAMSPANPFLAVQPQDCPPCFNCLLDAFPCSHFSKCNPYNGRCSCPPGFAGDNCSDP